MRNLATTTLLRLSKLLILSELNNSKTKQQLQNDRHEAEERLKDFKEKSLKNNY